MTLFSTLQTGLTKDRKGPQRTTKDHNEDRLLRA